MALKLGNTFPPLPYFAEQESSSPCCIKRFEGRKIQGKRTGAINIGTPSLLINLSQEEAVSMTRFLAGIDDSVEDERDLDQIMADQRAAEIERDTRDGVQQLASSPHLLHDQGKLSSKLYFRQN
ncbi:PREDICTED: DNA replication licensing factor [Prunus dulcis]|uniref:PREDICTED: DNA replication licensing factor n=1 Tax=Prunus dulcis TaxID=3755 RepID=A0A5E4FSC0_PRUDU|nr:PREDICTED: DNA replication licensing factor [Prunus dulcis]